VLHIIIIPLLDQESPIQKGHPCLVGVTTLLVKDAQLHLLIPHLKNLLPMVIWVTEVVYLYNKHLIFHCVSILDFLGGSKWEQMRPPKTDQKCRLGSCIIRRLSFAVIPQDEGHLLSFTHSLVVTSLTPLYVRMLISSIDSRGPFASYMGFLPI
jgi:hypothetical protein